MDCREVKKWLSPYLDSELGATQTFEVGEHLARCPACTTRFEAEQKVDTLMRDRLEQDLMPPELWEKIARRVSGTNRLSVSRGSRRLVLAACLLLAALVGTAFWPRTASGTRPAVVDAFLAAAPGGLPFQEVSGEELSLQDVLPQTMGLGIGKIPDGKRGGPRHEIRLVSKTSRVDQNGRKYVELRLNCCGQPVLLLLARRDRSVLPRPFSQVDIDRRGRAARAEDVNIYAKALGDVVAVAASRHVVRHIVGMLRAPGR